MTPETEGGKTRCRFEKMYIYHILLMNFKEECFTDGSDQPTHSTPGKA